ncbi:C40 family peptidase [Glycomyces buryatensis]|uniref:NlpC/P60 domain-containing protein n=1 Tax=Glycomyces buryatensis TaxID=2570927 RepID=A0A4S8QEJ7_9ACTN|nr:C40 family peptidase [Glycomyces buryatensis]THV41335.1 hypothetical protein FAB82_12325 [Glycomyces buryatensis]
MTAMRLVSRVLVATGAAAVVFAGALPAFAEPGVTIPDDGARPAGGETQDAPVTNPATEDGPLADQINRAQIDLAQLAEETTAAEDEWLTRVDRLGAAQTDWNEAAGELDSARSALDAVVGEAYTSISDLPAAELPDISGAAPLGNEFDLPGLASAVEDAETAETVAHASFDAASLSATRAEDRFTELDEALAQAQADLNKLIEDNREELEEIEEDREAAAAQHSNDFSSEVDGWEAAPEALKAVEYALAQLGKPYEWGAEGPNTFDCSGLTQSAYASANVTLPRVARDQFNATRDKPVDTEKLLPGDLLFWWDNPGEWQSVYHMGMYLGDGKMVQAPRTGDVVKISSIWFQNFAGAHRVVDAIQTDPDADPTGPSDNDSSTGGGGGGGGGGGDEPSEDPTSSKPIDPSPSPDPDPSPSPSPSESPSPDEPTTSDPGATEDDEEGPSPTVNETVSGTLSRETPTAESSGE